VFFLFALDDHPDTVQQSMSTMRPRSREVGKSTVVRDLSLAGRILTLACSRKWLIYRAGEGICRERPCQISWRETGVAHGSTNLEMQKPRLCLQLSELEADHLRKICSLSEAAEDDGSGNGEQHIARGSPNHTSTTRR
jgi:hypothetical protein